LTSNGTGLVQGLGNSLAGIKQWGDKAQAAVAGTVAGVAGKVVGGLSNTKALLAGAGTAIGTFLGGPIGAAIGGAVGTAAGGIVESIFGAVTAPFDNLNVFGGIVKQAESLNVSASQLQGLTQVLGRAGVEGEQVGAVFGKLGKKISDASRGEGDAAKTFQQLGLNAQQLLNLPVDEQFKAIADAISKLPPGAQQAAASMKLFEEGGVRLLPVLQKGGAGIQDFIEKQKKTGAVLSDSQLKAAADAAKAWKESRQAISSVWDGLVNRATLIAAPIVKFIGGVVTKAFALLTPVFDWIGRAIAKVSDILDAVFEVLSGWIDEAVSWITELVNSVGMFGDSWPSIETVVLQVLKAVAQGIGYVWDTLKAGVGAIAFVVSFLVEGFGKLVDAFKNTIKDLLELAGELPDDLGGKWFRDQAKNVDGLGANIQKAGKDMREWGKNAISTWGDSATKIGSWFDKLGQKKKAAEATKGVAGEGLQAKYNPIAAALKDSKEAYSIEAKWRGEALLGLNQPKKIEEKNNEELKKANQKLDKMINLWGISIPLKAG
jgi:hypothetical protein